MKTALVVMDWMLEDLGHLLGAHLDAFDVHAWFYELDARVVAAGIVLRQRDKGAWLQAETLAEAQRRGLPIAMASAGPTAGKLTMRLASALHNIRREEAAAIHGGLQMFERVAEQAGVATTDDVVEGVASAEHFRSRSITGGGR